MLMILLKLFIASLFVLIAIDIILYIIVIHKEKKNIEELKVKKDIDIHINKDSDNLY